MSPATPALAAPMQAAASEMYLFDAATLALVDANQAARQNLQLDHATLLTMTPVQLAPELDPAEFERLLGSLGEEVGAQVSLRTCHRRADGSSYPVKLCFLRIVRDDRALILAIGDDLSLEQAAATALEQYQARFNAIVSHTPGLVYQFVLHADGGIAFAYLSEGCAALLGLPATRLQQEPERFLQLILPEDRDGYLESMQASKASLSAWNWEGRIWIDAWKDVKWINLRSTPHALANGSVQWEGIMTNITASRLEQQAAQQSRARLAELTEHIELGKEQERTRIARELHDDLGGNLTAIKMALAMLATRLPPDQPALMDRANYLDDLVDRSIEAVHRISLALRPSTLDLGLVAALEWLAHDFEHRTGIACSFRCSERDIELAPEHASALFRIAQEALTNSAKHAQATQVTVALTRARRELILSVCDNGRGIGPGDRLKPNSFGLRGMSERARAMKGRLTLSAAPGGGTMVAIKTSLPATS